MMIQPLYGVLVWGWPARLLLGREIPEMGVRRLRSRRRERSYWLMLLLLPRLNLVVQKSWQTMMQRYEQNQARPLLHACCASSV